MYELDLSNPTTEYESENDMRLNWGYGALQAHRDDLDSRLAQSAVNLNPEDLWSMWDSMTIVNRSLLSMCLTAIEDGTTLFKKFSPKQ